MTITDLARRWNRKLSIGRGMSLSGEDLALLATIGVNDLIQTSAADELRKQCQQRIAQSRSTNEAISSSTQERGETSKSSGMTQSESGSEALARAQRTLGMVKPPSVGLPKLPRARKADPFIYFIRSGDDGPIKIGLSSKVAERHAGLQICCPDKLIIMASVQAPKEAERQLHQHFNPEWIRGEWFQASPRLLAFIEQVTVQ